MGEMTEAFIRQLEEHNKSMYVDRTDWTRQQWIDDADELMNHPDGAITSLCNGHVMALLEAISACKNLAIVAEDKGKNLQNTPELKLVGTAYVGMSERIFKALKGEV